MRGFAIPYNCKFAQAFLMLIYVKLYVLIKKTNMYYVENVEDVE